MGVVVGLFLGIVRSVSSCFFFYVLLGLTPTSIQAISFYTSSFYKKALRTCTTGRVPPEQRLYFTMLSAGLLPISLFWMAWTSMPSVPWIVPTLAGMPFGIAMLGIMTTVMAYLVRVLSNPDSYPVPSSDRHRYLQADTYTIYSASVFAANSLFRYIFGLVDVFSILLLVKLC